MPRSRLIKPDIMSDDDLAELPRDARLLYIYLWMVADRLGRLIDKPKRIKAICFPFDDDLGYHKISALLTDLQSKDFIIRYEVDNRKYIEIRSFTKHQRVHMREAESTYPAPTQAQQHQPSTNLGCAEASPRCPASTSTSNTDISNTSSGDDDYKTATLIIEKWNTTPGVRKVKKATDGRIEKIKTRLKNKNWKWEEALNKFPLQCFDNPDSWTPTFDWFIRPETVDKIIEGNYDWTPKTNGQSPIKDTIGQDIEGNNKKLPREYIEQLVESGQITQDEANKIMED